MARTSGETSAISLDAGEVRVPNADIRYHISKDLNLRYQRGNISGSIQAAYFIGSGTAARSLIWRMDGFLFEFPVAWYAQSGWNLAPGYEKRDTLSLSRAVGPECLNCHATGVRHRAGTENQYETPPVAEPGIGCERCHGPAGEHVKSGGPGAIVNPAKLSPPLRDSVCAQCHLTGVERVLRPGRSMLQFRAGDDVQAYSVTFLSNKLEERDLHTTSHFERLQTSACKKASGAKLWCGTCHEAHSRPDAVTRDAFYRSRCIACHKDSQHASAQRECLSCHMPRRPAADARLAQFTDHAIPRQTAHTISTKPDGLVQFSGRADTREEGLAWARIGTATSDSAALDRSRLLLERSYSAESTDPEVTAVLGYLRDRAGDTKGAVALYERVLRIDRSQTEAVMNLGSSYAVTGRLKEAVELWRDVAARNPGLESVWIKLASAYAVLGEKEAAREAARSCLKYHPDSKLMRDFLVETSGQ